MTTSQLSIDSRLVSRLAREYTRAIRAEENAATERQAYRLAAISERCLRRLQAAQAGLPLPEPRLPQTARNIAKQTFAVLASIGRAIARAMQAAAALRKAQAVNAARKIARQVRQSLRAAVRTVALAALASLVVTIVTTTEGSNMKITADTITDAQILELLRSNAINDYTYRVATMNVLGLGGERMLAREECVKAFYRARRLGGGITGDCPVGGCTRQAEAWGAPALVDGYADACAKHAQEAVEDAIEEQGGAS